METRYYVQKRKSFLKRILYVYLFLIITRILVVEFGVQIVQQKNTVSSPLFSNDKNAKILTLSSPYTFSLFGFITMMRSPPPQKGDIVLIESMDYKNQNIGKKIVFSFLEICTVGIIKQQKYTFVKVVGVSSQTIYYSAKTVFESKQEAEQAGGDIPFFDMITNVTLSDDEVFVMGNKEYSVDSRMFGAMKVSDIKGKAAFLLAPYWKRIGLVAKDTSLR